MLIHHHYTVKEQGRGNTRRAGLRVHSLFKLEEGSNVSAQLYRLLGSCSTVLDDTQSGLITCKLERKTLHSDRVFLFLCYVYKHIFFSLNSSVSHPSWLIISRLEEESHWKGIKARSKSQDKIFHSHFLFLGLFSGKHTISEKLFYQKLLASAE